MCKAAARFGAVLRFMLRLWCMCCGRYLPRSLKGDKLTDFAPIGGCSGCKGHLLQGTTTEQALAMCYQGEDGLYHYFAIL